MNPQVAALIFQDRRIAYAITDRALRVRETAGDPFLLWGNGLATPNGGVPPFLTALVPELVGSEEELYAILRGQRPRLRFQWVNRETNDAQPAYVTLSVHPHRDENDAIVGLVYLVEDVTTQGALQQELMQRHNELRLLQEQLEKRNEDLAAANAELRLMNEFKSSLVAVAAHELRTPLTSLYGYLELFLDNELGALTPDQQEYLLLMHDSARRLLTTTGNLVDMIRIDLDRVELVLRPVSLPEIVENAVARFEPQRQAQGQTLALHVDANLPAALCDPVRCEQVIGHLLNNACQNTPRGGQITLLVTQDDNGAYLRVSVQDTGAKIDACAQARLFERVPRAFLGRDQESRDMGLDLYIAGCLVELHGGSVWCESEPGKGNTFHATFPVADAGPEVSPVATSRLFART